jgi:hypothetical protein
VPRPRRYLLLVLPLVALLPLAAAPNQPPADPKAAADPLADLRRDPPQYARLMQETRAFLALPPERRERMRRLDEALRKAGGQEHLQRVLRRYADWLERLPEAQRRLVLEAPTRQTRVRNIRELRQSQWLDRQPKAIRSALEKLKTTADARPGLGALVPPAALGLAPATALLAPAKDGRPVLVDRLQKEERKRRHEWRIAVRHWDDLGKRPFPTRLSEFRPEGVVEKYVKEYLLPQFSPAEKGRLKWAEGRVVFPYVLVELADRHPPALPSERGPTRFAELPTDVQDHLKKQIIRKRPAKGWELIYNKQIRPSEGKWPRFGVAVTALAVRLNMKLSPRFEFWPSRPQDLSQEVRAFMDKQLLPRLPEEDRALLTKRQGKWPDFPQTIQELASKHGLRVPWQTLPGERKNWDVFRAPGKAAAAPALPAQPPRVMGRPGLAFADAWPFAAPRADE